MTDIDKVVEVMTEAQRQVGFGFTPALAITGSGEKWADLHYWQDPLQQEAFERVVAQWCVEHEDRTVVFVTPIIASTEDTKMIYRDPRLPLADGEHEQLFGLAIDADHGFDVLRCVVTRDGDVPTFGDIEMYDGGLALNPATPGFTLMQAMLVD